jgi:hypothetical protein
VRAQQARRVDLQEGTPSPGLEQLEPILDEVVALGMGEDGLQPVRKYSGMNPAIRKEWSASTWILRKRKSRTN